MNGFAMIAEALLYVCFVVGVWAIYMLVRNQFVYVARISFLDKEGYKVLEALPSYRDMLHSPKYILLWTADHWRAWLARRGTK